MMSSSSNNASPTIEPNKINPNVIIVGAGPFGLWTAIQLKLYDKNIEILMLEKYREYKRHHVLHIDPSSFKDSHPDKEFQDLLKNLSGYVPTSTIESALLTFAKKLNIHIHYQAVEDSSTLADQYPDCSIIIGADGARSNVRDKIFGNKMRFQENLNNIAELKYQVQGTTKSLSAIQFGSAIAQCNHTVFEYVGKEKEGVTSVSTRFVISDENTFNAMQSARGANYFQLDDDRINAKLQHSMALWLKTREKLTGEVRLKNSEKITVTDLNVYCSEESVKTYKGKKFILGGDAYCGLPYFRSLNNGLLGGSQLAQCIFYYLRGSTMPQKNKYAFSSFSSSSSSSFLAPPTEPLAFYSHYVQRKADKEYHIAKAKNAVVKMGQFSVASVQSSYQGSVIAKEAIEHTSSNIKEGSLTSLSFLSSKRKRPSSTTESTSSQESGCRIF